MEIHYSVYSAVRSVRKHLMYSKEYDDMLIMIDTDTDMCYVTEHDSELAKIVAKDYVEGEADHIDHASRYIVYHYIPTDYKHRWKSLYKDFKPSPISKEHVRGKLEVVSHETVEFSVNY